MSGLLDAALVASLFAVDPVGTGGVCIRSPVHPLRDQWLEVLKGLLPAGVPVRRIPCNIADGRLLGGLDLAATLRTGTPVAERGVLAQTDGGVLIVTMAERIGAHTAARINAVVDAGEAVSWREGVHLCDPARVGIVALDEGASEEEFVPASLADRLAFVQNFSDMSARAVMHPEHDAAEILAARRLLPDVSGDAGTIEALCATAMALGVESPRSALLALRAACAAAALCGRRNVREDDAVLAARLVLAPRATRVPAPPAETPSAEEPSAEKSPPEKTSTETSPPRADHAQRPSGAAPETAASEMLESSSPPDARDLQNVVLAAARAAIPNDLLERLGPASARRLARSADAGRSGAQRQASTRGRPYGVRSGAPRGDARLSVIETLRAAAPWQRLRGRTRPGGPTVKISKDDFRVLRYRQRAQTLTIFAVDASGSAALHRLAEAKGAVELLLAECYVRRDQVAVMAFRGRAAEILLPPTRSLVRAKRNLADMAGGGGTPLAAAIDAAAKLALQAQRRGETPTLVMLSDGRANVLRDGSGGREAAQAEALQAARGLRSARIRALFIDTSPRPNPLARSLAEQMDARYVPLPFADAHALLDAVKLSQ